MAFLQFPREQYFRILNTGENARLGYFDLQDGTELKHIMITIYVQGAGDAPSLVTGYSIRFNIYGNDALSDPIFQSDWAIISTQTLVPAPEAGTNWLGNIYLDFSGYPLNPNINYFMTVEPSVEYVRDNDNFYLGLNLDWYSEVNNQLTPGEAGARIRILGKR